jgi:hypothetical protein
MPLNITTKDFQETARELEKLVETDPEVAQSKELQDRFVEEKGLNTSEFDKAYIEYASEVEKGRTDFRPENSSVVSRFIGRAAGEVAEGVEDVGQLLTGKSFKAYLEEEAKKVYGEEVTDDFIKQAQEYLDPYHGDSTLGSIEDIGGQVASFFVPFTAGLKSVKAINAVGKAVSPASFRAGLRAIGNKKVAGFRVAPSARLGGYGVIGAGSSTFLSDPEEQAIKSIMESEDASAAIEALDSNPEDTTSQRYLDNFLTNLGYEAAFLGGGASIVGAYRIFKKTKPGQKITELGKKYIGRNFSSRGGTDDETLGLLVERNNASKKALAEADGLAQDLQRSIKKDRRLGSGVATADVVNAALAGDNAAKASLSTQTAKIVDKMRTNVDTLSEYISDKAFNGKLSAKITANLGTYLNRSYRIYDDASYRDKITKAVQEYKKTGRASNVDDQRLIEGAVNEIVTANPSIANSPEEIGRKLTDLIDVDKKDADAFFDIISSKSLTGTSKAGKKREDIPQDIRSLWGEVKDPSQKYMNTYVKLSEMKAEHQFMENLTEHLMRTGKLVADRPPNAGFEAVEDIARQRASAVFSSSAAKEYVTNPLARDLYMSPEYVRFLKDSNKPENINGIFEAWAKAKGLSQTTSTVYNPATHGRNFVGNMVLMLANGMLPVFGKGFGGAGKATLSRIRGYNNEELGKYVGKLQGYGLADSNVTLNIIRQNLNKSNNDRTMFSTLGDNKIARLYEGEDFLFKATHFEKTLETFKKAYKDDLATGAKSLTDLERMAAQRTRDTMPNYNLVPKAFKKLRAMPIGDFVAFPAEMARITKNIVKYNIEDILSGNAELQKRAYKSVAGLTSAGAVIPETMEAYSAEKFGIDDDKREALDAIDKPYYSGSNKIYLSPIKNNDSRKIQQVDRLVLGPLDPFDHLKVAAKGLHQALLTDDLNPQIANKVALAALDRTVSPFLGPSMITEALLKISNDPTSFDAYNDRTLSGAAIKAVARAYDINESAAAGASQLSSLFEPGFLTFIQQRKKYEEAKAKEMGASSLTDAIAQEPTGEELNDFYSPINADLIPDLFGFRKDTFDITGSMHRSLKPILRDIQTKGGSRYIQEATRRNLLPENTGKLKKLYLDDMEKHQKNQMTLQGMLDFYKTLGLNLDDFSRGASKYFVRNDLIKDNDLSTILEAYNNNFVPFNIGENKQSEIIQVNPQIDLREIGDIQGQLYNTKLNESR